MIPRQIVTLDTPEALAQHVARVIADRIQAAPGRFTIALSGGSTPKRLYEILAAAPFGAALPWDRVHLFWGDERLVPHTDRDSNYRMTREALLDHVPIPVANIHPVPEHVTPDEAAQQYQAALQDHYGSRALDTTRPLFDVTLLGLGENGHTASLFPGTPALEETLAWVVPVMENVPQPRLTLTYPAIASSRTVAFLVAGGNKSTVLRRVLDGDRSQPAARVTSAGDLIWFIDKAAAG